MLSSPAASTIPRGRTLSALRRRRARDLPAPLPYTPLLKISIERALSGLVCQDPGASLRLQPNFEDERAAVAVTSGDAAAAVVALAEDDARGGCSKAHLHDAS